jgi:hypothetical protein
LFVILKLVSSIICSVIAWLITTRIDERCKRLALKGQIAAIAILSAVGFLAVLAVDTNERQISHAGIPTTPTVQGSGAGIDDLYAKPQVNKEGTPRERTPLGMSPRTPESSSSELPAIEA